MKVFVYRNLRYRNKVMWSVRDHKTKLVKKHVSFIVIKNAELKVSKAGNKRVRKEKRKNVHAGVLGNPLNRWLPSPSIFDDCVYVSYNPYKHKSFIRVDNGKKINKADYVVLYSNGLVLAVNPRYE